jgi:C1A family cysteine protease
LEPFDKYWYFWFVENPDRKDSHQSTEEVNAKMEDEQEPLSAVNNLQKDNQALREKIQEYKKFEEDLIAQRVYEKAKKRLVYMITFGGIVLTIVGIIGLKSTVNYTKNLIVSKLESVSEEQINKIIQEEGKKQVRIIVKEQQSELEAILVATARQQINQITIASSPVRGGEKPTISVEPGLRRLDLTSFMTPIRHQGNEGSIVAFAVASALEYHIQKQLNEQVTISPRYLYYYSKLEAGWDPHADTGAFVRDAIKVLQTKGAVSEESWPYKPGDLQSEPPEGIKTATRYRIADSYQVNSLNEVKTALQKYGPVVGGISIFWASLNIKDVAKTGIIPDPSLDEPVTAAIAICIVGYDDDKKLIKFKNSWGAKWGDNGYGYISYTYVEKFLTDAWVFTI